LYTKLTNVVPSEANKQVLRRLEITIEQAETEARQARATLLAKWDPVEAAALPCKATAAALVLHLAYGTEPDFQKVVDAG
jgi:hypothetical protein